MAGIIDDYDKSVTTSAAPQSRISGAEVAQPYQELAQALDKGGEALGDIAVPLAERQAATAVTRDAQGNIQVAPPPIIFGAAGAAYSRVLKVGALAEADGDAKRQDIELREKFRDDPQGYQAAANAYKQKSIQDMTAAAGPEVGVALGRAIDTTTTQTYRGLLNEKERLDLERADGSIKAGINSATDDAMALARQGIAPTDPAMQQAVGKYSALLDERLQNPRLAYTQAQRDLDLQTFQSDIAANRFLYHIDDTYKKGGFQPAEEAAKDILTNTDYKLSDQQRESYYHKAIGEVRANEAIRRSDIGEARGAFNELSMASATGAKIDSDQVEQVANAFRAANDPGGAARVYASFARKSLNDDFGKQPIGDQVDQLGQIRGAATGGQVYNGLISRGFTPVQAAALAGNMQQESSFNPNSDNTREGAVGILQWRQDRRQALDAFAAARGKQATDLDTQLDFVAHEMKGSEAASAKPFLEAKDLESANAALHGYIRYGDDTEPTRLAYAKGFAGGQSASPANSAWLLANRQATMNGELWDAWKTSMKDYEEKDIRPNQDVVTQIIDGARATGNAAMLEQVSHDMARVDLAQTQAAKPLGQQQADISTLSAAGQAGALSPGQAATLKDLQTRYNSISKGLEENPISTAVANFPDKFKTPAPLDFGNPQNLVAALKQRGQIAQVAAQNWETGPLSAFDKQDLVAAKGALQNPDPAVKAGIYGAIATLPEDVRGATLRKLGGNEPAAMAEAAAGSMMANAPDISMSIFRGQTAMKADPRYDPEKENGTKATYLSDLDRALPASVFTLQDRTDPAGAYATTATMIKARYADLSAQAGQTTYDSARLQQAATDVTGGILRHNGGSLIAPARGMDQPTFDGILRGVTDNDMAGVRTLGGQPVSADYLRSNGQLESVGDGRYFVKLGADPMRPIYAYGPNPDAAYGAPVSKFILDLRGRAGAPSTMGDQDLSNPYGGG